MPVWYLIAIVLTAAGIFAAFKVVEKIL